MRPRHGFTLIGVVVVIALATTFLALTGPVFHRLFRAQADILRQTQRDQSLMRLGQVFRADVHQARRVAEIAEPAGLLLQGLAAPDQEVRYRIDREGVRREVLENGKIVSQDLFRLSPCSVRLTSLPEDVAVPSVRRVQVLLECPRSGATPSSRDQLNRSLRITAEVGRNARLEGRNPIETSAEDNP